MKKIIVAATTGIITLVPVKYAAADLAIGNQLCCTQEAVNTGSCERWFCTKNGITTEYTDCATCQTPGTMPEKKGPYDPCGDTVVFNVNIGECVLGGIIGPIVTACDSGTYGGNKGLCSPCPEPGTSDMGATEITDCYIPAGTVGSDDTGTYEYTADCHYSDLIIIDPGTPVEPVIP